MKKMALLMLVLCMSSLLFQGCNAFRFGFTMDRATDRCHLITGDKKNFGDRRLKYTMGYHRNTGLTIFLSRRPKPDFIYEYTEDKLYNIILFYPAIDSFFRFQEVSKRNSFLTITEIGRIDSCYKEAYERLKLLQPGLSH